MARGYAVLQKRLVELESELKQVLEIPLETTCHDDLSVSIKRRLGFLKNFLLQEIKSHPNEQQNLLRLDQRLNQLEKVFHDWDSCRTSMTNDNIDTSSTCSCTESCLDEYGSGSQDMGTDSPVYNKPDYSSGSPPDMGTDSPVHNEPDYGSGLSDMGTDSQVYNEPQKPVRSLDIEMDSPVPMRVLQKDGAVENLTATVTGGKVEEDMKFCRRVRMIGKARCILLMSVLVVVCGVMMTRVYDFCYCDVETEIFPTPT